jgi:hypothetical protein
VNYETAFFPLAGRLYRSSILGKAQLFSAGSNISVIEAD